MDKVITENVCQKALQNYTKTKECVLKSFSVSPVKELKGLVTDQSVINIKYSLHDEDKELMLFAKSLKSTNPVMYKLAREMKAYEREDFFYNILVPIFEAKGIACNYVPKCYFSEPFLIIMDNLKALGYDTFPRVKPFDMNQCKTCLELLARFHVNPIIYEMQRSKDLQRPYNLTENYKTFMESLTLSEGVRKYFEYSAIGLCELVDYVQEIKFDKNKFKIKLSSALKMLENTGENNHRSTLLHGDLWCSNFMVKTKENNDIDSCLLIDFQTITYGPPASDVMQFIYSNTSKIFREKHQDELLSHYYNCFSNLLNANQLEAETILSESEFRQTCQEYVLPTKVFSTTDRCITAVSDEDHYKVSQIPENYEKFLYEDRGKYAIKAFEENPEFRQIILEDIEELKNILFGLEQ